MTTFEEQFPSLNNFTVWRDDCNSSSLYVYSGNIERYCLDKQEVRKAWKTILLHAKSQSEITNNNTYASIASELFYMFNKELGL
jgi:hypothetical protein